MVPEVDRRWQQNNFPWTTIANPNKDHYKAKKVENSNAIMNQRKIESYRKLFPLKTSNNYNFITLSISFS